MALVGCGEGGTNEVQSASPTGGAAGEITKDTKEPDKGMATPSEAGTE
jgi:hypothetical protein